jgi:hypothetical protein
MHISSSIHRRAEVRSDVFSGRIFVDLCTHAGIPVVTLQLSPDEAKDLLSALDAGLEIVNSEPEEKATT